MPDEWEYPWFAAWDLAFHCVALAHIDPDFAKEQLMLMCRKWAMHPNGQLPAYEWNFSDVNPPVHAWAAWQVYCIDGRRDRTFLVRGRLLGHGQCRALRSQRALAGRAAFGAVGCDEWLDRVGRQPDLPLG